MTTIREQITEHLGRMFARNEFKYSSVDEHLQEMGLEVPVEDVTESKNPTTAQVVIGRGPEFYSTKKANVDTKKSIATKYGEFLGFKRQHPFEKAPGDDTPFLAAGPFGKLNPSLWHYKLSQDLSVVYRVYKDGSNRVNLDVYGFFTHADLGDTDTKKSGIMAQRATKFERAKFKYNESVETATEVATEVVQESTLEVPTEVKPEPTGLTESETIWLRKAAGLIE